MGAGSSTEQRSPEQPEAGSTTPAEPQPGDGGGGSPATEAAPGAPGDPAIAAADPATKLLQKNGQLSTVNGLAEQGELSVQEEALTGQEEEVIVTDVGQRDTESVSERDSDKEMAANSAVVQDIAKDGPEETPEIIEQIPSSESNLEELTQPAESQTNDVGFKKVFKFVGFKFTVKKDKNEKSDGVRLLTVRKDEGEGTGESDGAGDHQEPSRDTGEATAKENELTQSTEKPEETGKHEQSDTDVSLPAESGQAAEEAKDGEEKQEKEPTKSPDSPTSPMASETASPFKKFFTQGWAGWRKKTSFRKPKEDELVEASEKRKEQEPDRADTEGNEKREDSAEERATSEQPHPQEATDSASDARLPAECEQVELPSEGQVHGFPEEKSAPLASEVFDEKVEIVAEVHVSTTEKKTEEQEAEVEEIEQPLPTEKLLETNAELQEAEPAEELVKTKAVCAPGGDHTQPAEPSPDDRALSTHPEGIMSEAEMLSSQERVKVQGSPLKKLFTSTGLKKLSGKKQKAKRGGGDEESGEHQQVAAESPDSTDEQKGESSASSPDEPEEITCLEKGIADPPQEGEGEEGSTSDGEKKREGITPWASFKKMVTPKKRVRRLSESDKEDELEKVKSATLSSTESAASEMQEDGRGHGEEQKPEEPKRKVDTSVSWEALICVGSSKKRARKASSSDEEGAPKPTGGEGQKPDEAGKDREAGPDAPLASSQEHDQAQGSSSPEQAGSPSEGEGVSTWESFKRLVTARKKSKSKLEEKNEDSGAGTGVEHSASEVEPGKEESWVSIKKFIPGRRKKRSDGKQEQTAIEDTGPAEATEDDADVPAVIPLSEYDAVEREKMEAQEARKSEERPERQVAVYVSEEVSKSLVHRLVVADIDGARAVTSIEERSPSWISASVTEPLEQEVDEAKPPAGQVFEREGIAEETPIVTKTLPESQDAGDDTIISEVELTSEAVTAAETTEAFCAEEATEASGAEETTDMVSAVSQLTDSPDTTEEATPVQEVEDVPDMEDQRRRTQEVLQAVAEKVRGDSQLPDTRGPEDTIQTMQKAGSKKLEKVEEAEEDSPVLDLKQETDVVLKVQVEETKAEDLTQGKVIVRATPEHAANVPQVTESVESSELTAACQPETLIGVKSEIILQHAVAPDSAETLTDSETNGSTPVADFEAPHITQQDKITEIHKDKEAASVTQSQVTAAEAVPAPKEMPPAPSGFQSQEDHGEHSKLEETLDHTDKEVFVETTLILSKTEVIQGAGRFADEETKDVPSVEGPEVSADTEMTADQKEIIEVALKDEATPEAEFQKNGFKLQSPAQSLPTPLEREMVVQAERQEVEAKLSRVSEEKLEQTPAEELAKPPAQTTHVTVTDGGKGATSFEESSWLVQEEVVCTEIQVQSSEASLPLTAAAVEENISGETVKILETAGTLESADAHFVLEEKSVKDEAFPAQLGEDAVPVGTKSQAESSPVIVSATPEKGTSADLEQDKTTSQKEKSEEEGEQVSRREVRVTETGEEDLKAESEILKLQTESCKLVQNVIQTAVDQLVSVEETATDGRTPARLIKADNQEAGQEVEKEEREFQASVEDETLITTGAKEESALATVEQTHSDLSRDVNGASEEITTREAKSSGVSDQQLEEGILPAPEEREATGTKSVPEDDRAGLGERIEKSLSESQEDEKGDDYFANQTSALEDAEALGGLTKESPDANGPKLQEKEIEFHEVEEHSESEKEIKTQTQEEAQKQGREPETSELTES